MKEVVYESFEVVKPKVDNPKKRKGHSKNNSHYREDKTGCHTTVNGKGVIGRIK